MIIIIEGPDGAGKTTIAEYLSKHLQMPIKHRSKPITEEEKQQMMQSYVDDIENCSNVIWDRCFYSEMVYGPLMRDKSYINYDGMVELEKKLVQKGAMIIYCTDNAHNLWERCQQRGETYITDFEKIKDIKDAYDELMLKAQHLIPITTHRIPGGKWE